MALLDEIKRIAQQAGAILDEKKGVYTFRALVAERKAFLSKKRLEYIAKFRIDDTGKEIWFTEMLKESGSGLSAGGDMEDMSPGFGFRASVYKTGMGGREGTIEEQSNLFGKTYAYKFDFRAIKGQFESTAQSAKYNPLLRVVLQSHARLPQGARPAPAGTARSASSRGRPGAASHPADLGAPDPQDLQGRPPPVPTLWRDHEGHRRDRG